MMKTKVEIKIKNQWLDVTSYGYLVKGVCCNLCKKQTLEFKYESLKNIPDFEPKILELKMRITTNDKIVFKGNCTGFEMNFIKARFEFQDSSYILEVIAKEQTYKFEKMPLSKAIEKILISNGKNGIDMDIYRHAEINGEFNTVNMTILEVLQTLVKECSCNLHFAVDKDTQQPILIVERNKF